VSLVRSERVLGPTAECAELQRAGVQREEWVLTVNNLWINPPMWWYGDHRYHFNIAPYLPALDEWAFEAWERMAFGGVQVDRTVPHAAR
jgi:hypothetical protein